MKETVEPVDESINSSVVDTRAETTEGMERPTVGQGFDEALDADIQEVPPVTQPSVDDEWLPEPEPKGGDAPGDVQDSDIEDVADVMSRRQNAKGKLRMNESRTRVGNMRIPKNITAVSTANVSLNFEEEEPRWRFVANRRIAVEKMSETTKKNPNIMGILEEEESCQPLQQLDPTIRSWSRSLSAT
ncbi:hypothetical protein LIER_30328 [Lithospermum erythrorhizon]|uniref:Uncharacterized protein n=1 Tax=Lithospermum erythrorhizon TaxID=34254 RepID=A0AAV3RRA3_LITER